MATGICQNCGTEFTYKPGQHRGKYCTHACYLATKGDRRKKRVPCAHCGVMTEKAQWYIERRKHIFCSSGCHDQWRSENQRGSNHHQYDRVRLSCEQCGVEIERTESQLAKGRHHFCGIECSNEWRRENSATGMAHHSFKSIPVECDNCGAALMRPPWRLEGYDHQFCDLTCQGAWATKTRIGENAPNWRGGHIYYYGPNWLGQRRAVLERDNYTCQRCGIAQDDLGRELDIHHIRPFREFGYILGENTTYLEANDLGNLVALCVSCHKATEWKTE